MSRLRLVAGPNGSGKTTLTRTLVREKVFLGQYLNPDDIAKHIELTEILTDAANSVNETFDLTAISKDLAANFSVITAQKIAQGLRKDWLQQDLSLTYESVMSHESHLDFVDNATRLGFDSYLYYICTSDPDLNILRIKTRTQSGGHDVPDDKVRSRYDKSLSLLYDMASKCKRAYFFDNAKEQIHFAEITPDGYLDIFEKEFEEAQPYWFVDHLLKKWEPKMVRRATL